jgi:hypothetical protein
MAVLITTLSEPLQLLPVVIMATYFLLAIFGIRSRREWLSATASAAPSVLTSVGIFFTFLGIFIALSNFDVKNINSAVPLLLGGLKLAFFSSVVGVGLSVVFRAIQAGLASEVAPTEVTAGHLLEELKNLNGNTISVKEALTGEGDASVATQLSKLRNDFRDFADKMREESTSAIIEALEQVVRDFNKNLTEQFGDNFKRLNEAVEKLLEWQQEYKSQVEVLTENSRARMFCYPLRDFVLSEPELPK